MLDYEPISLAEHLNGGLDALGTGASAEICARHFRGLPFAINEDPSMCFISLDGDSEQVTVPVGRSASRIIFAHRLFSHPKSTTAGRSASTSPIMYSHWRTDSSRLSPSESALK